jgi:hypothetical protein
VNPNLVSILTWLRQREFQRCLVSRVPVLALETPHPISHARHAWGVRVGERGNSFIAKFGPRAPAKRTGK